MVRVCGYYFCLHFYYYYDFFFPSIVFHSLFAHEVCFFGLPGGQYPLSVLALQEHVAKKYVVGLYGNTMTTNPRALDIARDVLVNVTPAVRANILERGVEFQKVFRALVAKHPKVLSKVTGSGMIQAVHVTPQVKMFDTLESNTVSFLTRCRHAGLGVINAGHSVKFTPHFELSSHEVHALGETFDAVCTAYAAEVKL